MKIVEKHWVLPTIALNKVLVRAGAIPTHSKSSGTQLTLATNLNNCSFTASCFVLIAAQELQDRGIRNGGVLITELPDPLKLEHSVTWREIEIVLQDKENKG